MFRMRSIFENPVVQNIVKSFNILYKSTIFAFSIKVSEYLLQNEK